MGRIVKNVLNIVSFNRVKMYQLSVYENIINNFSIYENSEINVLSFEDNELNNFTFDSSNPFKNITYNKSSNNIGNAYFLQADQSLKIITVPELLNHWVKKAHTVTSRVPTRMGKSPDYYGYGPNEGTSFSIIRGKAKRPIRNKSPQARRPYNLNKAKLKQYKVMVNPSMEQLSRGDIVFACESSHEWMGNEGINPNYVLSNYLTNSSNYYIVAVKAPNINKLMGLIIAQKEPVLNHKETMEIFILCSAPGSGLGKALIEKVENYVKNRFNGVKYFILDAVGSAVPFYLKIGFKVADCNDPTQNFKYCSLIRSKNADETFTYMYRPLYGV